MAKKGQQVQLQAELNTDEEWEKFLAKDGLLVIDVYSDWCGPCSGMAANLKKIKLDQGGDLLQLAIAKSDNIEELKRFRGRSEPTWLFVSKGKKVNLLFGCNAPQLTRLILEELKNEEQAVSGEKPREYVSEITELDEIEIRREEAAEAIIRAAREKEEAKREKEFHERKVAECNNILENLSHLGTILIFPSGRDRYHDALDDLLKEASVIATQTEKVNMTEEKLQQMLYFQEMGDEEEYLFDEYSLYDLYNNQCLIIVIKPAHGAEIEDIDSLLLEIVYGPTMKPPGSEDCPYRKMLSEAVDEESGEHITLTGIWAPSVACVKATILRLFFPKLASAYEIPDPEPEPEHLALVFDTRKIRDALHVMSQWPDQIMHYGFFSNEDPHDTELIAKSVQRLEKPAYRDKRTFQEKLIIQVSKKKSECVLAFAQIGPSYISPNPQEGAKECQLFFPDDYAESLTEEEQVFMEEIEMEAEVVEEETKVETEEKEDEEQEMEEEMWEEGMEEELDFDMFDF
ncbi:thioredoxin domain-containing protein 6-like isoform X1 [Diabrotica virgifera virgifera]|uniref:Thioredoxin domain-containing protein 6 n=1 Tax=Diabrotica virgifera virgifera TaxID=50390 RepID=A0ABM5K4C4_DIAVI|nr:thioredoxin domain-containing protein 6-like isoform X1 [Diabrotica virgifera virgifera]